MNNNPARTLLLLVILASIALLLMQAIGPVAGFQQAAGDQLSTSQLLDAVDNDAVVSAVWQKKTVTGTYRPGGRSSSTVRPFQAMVPDADSSGALPFVQALKDHHVNWSLVAPPITDGILAILSMITFPLMIIALIYFLVLRPRR